MLPDAVLTRIIDTLPTRQLLTVHAVSASLRGVIRNSRGLRVRFNMSVRAEARLAALDTVVQTEPLLDLRPAPQGLGLMACTQPAAPRRWTEQRLFGEERQVGCISSAVQTLCTTPQWAPLEGPKTNSLDQNHLLGAVPASAPTRPFLRRTRRTEVKTVGRYFFNHTSVVTQNSIEHTFGPGV